MTTELDKYFRVEAAELLDALTRGLLDLEKEPHRSDLLGQCFRFAHTLKGAARMARRPHIGELAHAIEDTLAQYRETGEPIERADVTDLLAILQTIRLEMGDLERPPAGVMGEPKPGEPQRAVEDEWLKTVRVDIAAMEGLFDELSEMAVQLFPLRAGVDALTRATQRIAALVQRLRSEQDANNSSDSSASNVFESITDLQNLLKSSHRDISSSFERIERDLERVREVAAALRLVPVNTIVAPLELAAREAAEALGKDIGFEVDGGSIRIEGQILSAVRDALLHTIRNAVDHGIEPASERFAAGKPRAGQIRLEVERKARRVVFRVSDDGRGVDEQAVRRAAVRHGAIDAARADALSTEEALALIFRAGVSTRESTTEVSGRGVGLDVVSELANRLRGDVGLRSEKGRGTTLTLEVPVSSSSLVVLSIELAAETLLIPLDGVRGTRLVNASEIAAGPAGQHLLHEGRAVPFISLARLLGRKDARMAARSQSVVVIVEFDDRLIALGVDRVDGVVEVMVKPLPSAAGSPLLVAGVAFDARGDPLLVLDPRGLVLTAAGTQFEPHVIQSPGQSFPILIIDDSLTTRMLEQSILESAGYEVDLAASAEEGLRMAARRRYGLFVVDVEMPGMNGFEFTAKTRADPALRAIPVVMVTSLASAADRRRGIDVGASAYIVKGEFDQKEFVEKVAELLGSNHA